MGFIGLLLGLALGAAVEDIEGAFWGAIIGALAGVAIRKTWVSPGERQLRALEREVERLRESLNDALHRLNLLEILKAVALEPKYRRARPKRLRFAVFTQIGQLIHHARVAWVRVPKAVFQLRRRSGLCFAAARRASSVLDLSQDVQVFVGSEECPQALPEQGVVIRYDDGMLLLLHSPGNRLQTWV